MLKKISKITNVPCPVYNIPVVMMLAVPYTNTESHRIRGSLGTLAVTENFTILLQKPCGTSLTNSVTQEVKILSTHSSIALWS